MNYLLDTNVCIRYLSGRSPALRQKLPTVPSNAILICSVVKFELIYGAMRSQTPTRSLSKQEEFWRQFASLSFDDDAARLCGQLRADLAQKGTPIGPYDLQIAAIALNHDLILVTHNIAEFSRVEGLKIEDWEINER